MTTKHSLADVTDETNVFILYCVHLTVKRLNSFLLFSLLLLLLKMIQFQMIDWISTGKVKGYAENSCQNFKNLWTTTGV